MVEFARLFDPALVASISDIGLRLADPPRLAGDPIVRPAVARHGGSALAALDLRAAASPLVPTVTPRFEKNSRSRSTARVTRFCAAWSEVPRVTPTSRRDLFSK